MHIDILKLFRVEINFQRVWDSHHLASQVSTDLFGRGIDIERVNIVINYDMPDESDTACVKMCEVIFIHSFIHSFIPSFLHSFFHSFIFAFHSFVHSFIHSFIPSFLHSFIHSFLPFIFSFFHSIHSILCYSIPCHSFLRMRPPIPGHLGVYLFFLV